MPTPTLRLGRDPSCHIRVVDPTVSARHAELTLTRDGELFVTDCRSRNGTAIVQDGQKRTITQSAVPHGARVAFGDCVFEAARLLEILRSSARARPEHREPEVAAPDASVFLRCLKCSHPNPNTTSTCANCGALLPRIEDIP